MAGLIFLGIVYISLHFYAAWRIIGWIHVFFPTFKWYFFGLPYCLLSASFLMGFVLPSTNLACRIIKQIGFYRIGFFLYFLLFLFLFELIRLLLSLVKKSRSFFKRKKTVLAAGILLFSLTSSIFAYGVVHTRQIIPKSYPVVIHETSPITSLNVVLLSDLHLGLTNKTKQVENIVRTIQSLHPDLVCLAGDIIDNDISAVEEKEEIIRLFRSISAEYGVYACLGNHDVDSMRIQTGSGHEQIDAFLAECGITLLQDEAVFIADSFYLVGRKDASPILQQNHSRMTIDSLLADLDPSKPIIMLDHQPREIAQAEECGVDLLLCGHTHHGQMFPANLVTNALFQLGYGFLKTGQTQVIVTSGAGVWGPPLRVGTDCEVVQILISFSQDPS